MNSGPHFSSSEELDEEEEQDDEELELEEEEDVQSLDEDEEQSVLLRDEEYPLVEYEMAPLPAAAKVKAEAIKVETKTVDFIVLLIWRERGGLSTFANLSEIKV